MIVDSKRKSTCTATLGQFSQLAYEFELSSDLQHLE